MFNNTFSSFLTLSIHSYIVACARSMVDSPNCVRGEYAFGNILLPGVAPHLLVANTGIDHICSICLYGRTNLNY